MIPDRWDFVYRRLNERIAALRRLIHIVGWLYLAAAYGFLGLRALFSEQWLIGLLSNFTLFMFAPLIAVFPAAVFARARRLTIWMLPLMTGGLFWVGRYFTPKVHSPPAHPLSVVTFNVWVDNPALDRAETWLREAEADIILLQEVPPAWAAGIEGLADAYPYQAAQPHLPSGMGKLILSRHPILSLTPFRLTEDDIFVQQRAVIDVNGTAIAVYNLHLFPLKGDHPRLIVRPYNPLINTLLAYDETIRRAQVDDLLRRVAADPLPYIAAGDFNFSDQNRLYDRLAGTMRDAFMEAGTGFGWTWRAGTGEPTHRLIPTLARLDYVWHGAGIRAAAAEVGPEIGSDHYPVRVVLDIGGGMGDE
jgi:endonuclease/exonuclease/phosphatase (EEP) superfamily protein YafD